MPGYICFPYAPLAFALAGERERTILQQTCRLHPFISSRRTKMTVMMSSELGPGKLTAPKLQKECRVFSAHNFLFPPGPMNLQLFEARQRHVNCGRHLDVGVVTRQSGPPSFPI